MEREVYRIAEQSGENFLTSVARVPDLWKDAAFRISKRNNPLRILVTPVSGQAPAHRRMR